LAQEIDDASTGISAASKTAVIRETSASTDQQTAYGARYSSCPTGDKTVDASGARYASKARTDYASCAERH
jgi:hypothetical protein